MKHIARACAGLIVIAYFLPWMDMMIASMSGFTMGKMAISTMGEGPPTPPWVYASLLFVVLGIASAAINRKREHIVSGIFVLLTVAWPLALIGMVDGPIAFKVVGIGLWITLAAAIGQIVGAFMLEESPAGDSVESGETAEE